MSQNAPNIIKVVNLKRFLPETLLETRPKLKRSWGCPSINPVLPHIKTETENTLDFVTIAKDIKPEIIDNSSEIKNSESTKQVAATRNKVRFRNCSHSPEELSILHEHVDETLVKLGDTFESRDCFKQYLNDNAKRWHYYYICRNSKQKIIEYNCICMAYKNKEREVVIRRQKKRTTACPCKIRLTIDQCTSKLVVYYVCNHHDHETTPSAFYNYPHAKYLPQNVKEEFLDLTFLGLDVDLIQKYIHSVIGLTIKKKDIWSYTYRFKRKIFERSISEERKKYIDDLIISIRKTYGEPYESTLPLNEKPSNKPSMVDFSPIDDIKMNDNEEERILKEVGDITDTEIIVQYINEQGILCDENGIPITNSSAIIQFINNYTQAPPEIHVSDDFLEQGTIVSELVDNIHEDVYPIDWETVQTQTEERSVVCHEAPCDENNDLAPKADIVEESVNIIEPVCSQDTADEINESDHIQRLSPTPNTTPVYAEMDNFSRYYYIDHRYIPREENSSKEKSTLFKKNRHCASNVEGNLVSAREEYVKAPDFVYWPTSIRHCSGHDHLTVLAHPEAIHPGAKFITHDVFLSYINEHANHWFFYYSLVESGKAPENYVYKCVYGRHRVSKNAYRAKGLRRRNKITTQCPCQIRLRRLESDSAYLTVLYSCNHHDHALDERHFNAQPHSRRLPQHIKEEVKDLLTLNVGADILRKYVAAETGVRVYGKYFHNVRVGMRRRNEERHFTEERLQALTKKIRELEATFGNTAKENPQATYPENQPKKRKLPPLQEYFELSDKDDFAEEVYIAQADTQPPEGTAKQSRSETCLQTISHQEILMKVRKLQDSVRCDGLRNDAHVIHTIVTP